ncbi:MAG: ComEC/Rec2 family competence protein [Phycisphaeraceae bacterium]|nr:ComEC/Rec2 family competence protein [Phycisphaeraceae bacterium]
MIRHAGQDGAWATGSGGSGASGEVGGEDAKSPVIWLSLAWAAGIGLGQSFGSIWIWITLGGVALAAALALTRRNAWRWLAVVVGVVSIGAAWSAAHLRYAPVDDIRQVVTDESQLAQVEGEVVGPVMLSPTQRGAMGKFAFQPPGTLFQLHCRRVWRNGQWVSASGDLLVKIEQVDTRLGDGQLIGVTGWLSAIDGPLNPGERDYKAMLAEQGVWGRLTLPNVGNVTRLGLAPPLGWWSSLRRQVMDVALGSLRQGIAPGPQRGLLETMLLGRWEGMTSQVDQSFREVGLTHLLSISGAHLGILMWLTWSLVRLTSLHPAKAAMIVLTVLATYLLVLPVQVPIVRSGILAGMLCLGWITGRRVSSLKVLMIALALVLAWRPGDLGNAGLQLSFGVVAALLMFTRPLGQWIWPDPLVEHGSLTAAGMRVIADFLAANLVAFFVALPVVAYHFQLITPLNVLMTILSLPAVTAMLGLGYLKMALGLALPSGGLLLAGPLRWTAEVLLSLVQEGARWPGASWRLTTSPSLAWTVAVLLVVVAWLAGRFAGRKLALSAAVIGCSLWLVIQVRTPAMLETNQAIADAVGTPTSVRLRVSAIAVGNGSCFLVRIYDEHPLWRHPWTMLFDCGSQEYLDVGLRSILPALRSMGVAKLDMLALSHADMDHYCGTLDVIDGMAVGQVLTTPQLLADARCEPRGATAFLIQGIESRGVPIRLATEGWSLSPGHATITALWPPSPEHWSTPRNNDESLVLRFDVAGRRLILGGDIQQVAITQLLARGANLKADICDLPHHGSFVEASPRYLAAVSPSIVLQSSGKARLRRDRWASLIRQHDIHRLITATQGLSQAQVAANGDLSWSVFRDSPVSLDVSR